MTPYTNRRQESMSDAILKLQILRDMLRSSYGEWRREVWGRDLDENYCCSGRECCCGGMSVRQMWRYEQQGEDDERGSEHRR